MCRKDFFISSEGDRRIDAVFKHLIFSSASCLSCLRINLLVPFHIYVTIWSGIGQVAGILGHFLDRQIFKPLFAYSIFISIALLQKINVFCIWGFQLFRWLCIVHLMFSLLFLCSVLIQKNLYLYASNRITSFRSSSFLVLCWFTLSQCLYIHRLYLLRIGYFATNFFATIIFHHWTSS